MEPYYTSLRGLFNEQFHGVVGDVACTSIVMHERQRKIDRKTVGELSESIEKTGLLQPIGVRYSNKGEDGAYHLVFGAHRFTAWVEKFEAACDAKDEAGMARWRTIPAVVFGEDRVMSDDMMLLLELTENVYRKDLTTGERKAMASQVGELYSKLEGGKTSKKTKTSKPPLKAWRRPTMKALAEASGVPHQTYEKWYRAYRLNNPRRPTWQKQTEAQYNAWLNHLKAEAQREEEAAEKAERDKANCRKEKALKVMDAAVSDYVGLFGKDGVLEHLKGVIDEAGI